MENLKTIKVSQAMNKKPVYISPEETLPKCARKMLTNNIGCMLITENDHLKEIVTEKDIVENAVGKELNI